MRIRRKIAVVNESRWKKYVATSAATFLWVVPTAVEADFVWTDVDVELKTGLFGPYSISGFDAFTFRHAATGSGGVLFMYGQSMSVAGTYLGGYLYVSNLPYGQTVSSAANNWLAPANPIRRWDLGWGTGYTNSQFLDPGTGYVGFRFDVGNGTQYGYIELELVGAPQNLATLVGYGWGMPGEEVTLGQRPVPEASSLASLACGALGLMAWRRRRIAPNGNS